LIHPEKSSLRGKDLSAEELATIRRRLRGKPLRSRLVQLLIPVGFTLACAVTLIAVLNFADGVWMIIGLTVLAFIAGHIPEVFVDSRYSVYREEWEVANAPNTDPDLDAADEA
jgi:membrane protein YdbS with pleckstrin-like domain